MATTMAVTSTTSTTASTPPPLVVMITGGGTLTAGTSHSLTCTASGGASMTYTYQWLRNDEVLNNQNLPNMYSFSPLREADVGRDNCRVSVSSMTITSNDVVINVEGECIMMITFFTIRLMLMAFMFLVRISPH